MADNKEELELALIDFDKLGTHSLFLNVNKSQIMSNKQEMEKITEIKGIKVNKSIRYLGTYIFC
jgi:hypothetical protein